MKYNSCNSHQRNKKLICDAECLSYDTYQCTVWRWQAAPNQMWKTLCQEISTVSCSQITINKLKISSFPHSVVEYCVPRSSTSVSWHSVYGMYITWMDMFDCPSWLSYQLQAIGFIVQYYIKLLAIIQQIWYLHKSAVWGTEKHPSTAVQITD